MLPLGSSLLQLFRFRNLEKMMKKKRDLDIKTLIFFSREWGSLLSRATREKLLRAFHSRKGECVIYLL